MAKIYCKSSYLLRKDTAENWQNKNPILRKGEQGLETDTGIIKIGDGVTAFNSLSDDNIYLPKRYANATFSNTLKGSASGSAILIDDISPVTHEMGIRVRGKNILPYPFAYATFESYGVTFTDNKDGTITLNGKNNGTSMSNYNIFTTSDKLSFLKPNTDYYLSCNLDNIIKSLRTVKSDGTYKYYSYGNINFSPDETPDRLFIQVKTTDTTTYDNTVVKLQIEKGTTATDYTPYIPDLTAVKVRKLGKNLLPYPYFDSSKSSEGATITVNGDRSISFSGIPTSYVGFVLYKGNALVKSGTFTISVGNLTNVDTSLFIYDSSGATLYTIRTNKNITVNADDYPTAATWNISMSRSTSNTEMDGTAYPQIELGTTITEYEPYNGTEYTPNADGTVNGVTSLYPNTTLTTDTDGVLIECEYNRDINKAFTELQQAIISSGGNI